MRNFVGLDCLGKLYKLAPLFTLLISWALCVLALNIDPTSTQYQLTTLDYLRIVAPIISTVLCLFVYQDAIGSLQKYNNILWFLLPVSLVLSNVVNGLGLHFFFFPVLMICVSTLCCIACADHKFHERFSIEPIFLLIGLTFFIFLTVFVVFFIDNLRTNLDTGWFSGYRAYELQDFSRWSFATPRATGQSRTALLLFILVISFAYYSEKLKRTAVALAGFFAFSWVYYQSRGQVVMLISLMVVFALAQPMLAKTTLTRLKKI